MKKEDLIFRMAARCEAAGRPNNEDNYQVDENLADDRWGFTADKEISLGEKGAMLVVCDGMGGMNAGEVASAIAVATIKEWFDKEKLTNKILESPASIQRFLVDAIQAADEAIKADGKANPEHEGMGSTIVMAWLLGKKVYVGWCGDSRAYRYNPKTGLQRLSHDHSYVQELVDAGKLTEELAFDHPNNNIITRSLGDPRGKAQPDTKEYDLCNEDIIMLCSDGLCGCLRDNEIEDVIKQHQTSMQECRDALWEADEIAGWHDNVTIALAQVISGGAIATESSSVQPMSNSKAELIRKNRRLKMILGVIIAIFVLACAGYGYHRLMPEFADNKGENGIDSMNVKSLVPNEDNTANHDETSQKKHEEASKADEVKTVTSPISAEVKTSPTNDSQNVQGENKAADYGKVSQGTQENGEKKAVTIQSSAEKDAQHDPLKKKLDELQPERKEQKVDVVTVPPVVNDSVAEEKATLDIGKQIEGEDSK